MSARPPIIGVAGWKNSGKTTLAVRLIEEFTRRGLRVVSVKHAHHAFQIDDGETDSAKHRRAGAARVAIVSATRFALVSELRDEPEPSFSQVVAALGPCDLVVVEGYKTEPIPKIEARRLGAKDKRPLSKDDPTVIAVAADHSIEDERVPVFALDDIAAIADCVAARLGLAP